MIWNLKLLTHQGDSAVFRVRIFSYSKTPKNFPATVLCKRNANFNLWSKLLGMSHCLGKNGAVLPECCRALDCCLLGLVNTVLRVTETSGDAFCVALRKENSSAKIRLRVLRRRNANLTCGDTFCVVLRKENSSTFFFCLSAIWPRWPDC